MQTGIKELIMEEKSVSTEKLQEHSKEVEVVTPINRKKFEVKDYAEYTKTIIIHFDSCV